MVSAAKGEIIMSASRYGSRTPCTAPLVPFCALADIPGLGGTGDGLGVGRGPNWAGPPKIASVGRLPCHTGHIRDEPPDSNSEPRGNRSRGCPQAGFTGG